MAYAKTYYLNFSFLLSEEAIRSHLHLVSSERQQRIETTNRLETKASLLAAGILFNEVMTKSFGISDLEIQTNEYGKPYLKNHPSLYPQRARKGYRILALMMRGSQIRTPRPPLR